MGFFEKLDDVRNKPLVVRVAIARGIALIVVVLVGMLALGLAAR